MISKVWIVFHCWSPRSDRMANEESKLNHHVYHSCVSTLPSKCPDGFCPRAQELDNPDYQFKFRWLPTPPWSPSQSRIPCHHYCLTSGSLVTEHILLMVPWLWAEILSEIVQIHSRSQLSPGKNIQPKFYNIVLFLVYSLLYWLIYGKWCFHLR